MSNLFGTGQRGAPRLGMGRTSSASGLAVAPNANTVSRPSGGLGSSSSAFGSQEQSTQPTYRGGEGAGNWEWEPGSGWVWKTRRVAVVNTPENRPDINFKKPKAGAELTEGLRYERDPNAALAPPDESLPYFKEMATMAINKQLRRGRTQAYSGSF